MSASYTTRREHPIHCMESQLHFAEDIQVGVAGFRIFNFGGLQFIGGNIHCIAKLRVGWR